MKTRRSRKSFEPYSPKKRRKSKGKKKGKPLEPVNETIVISDSEPETEQPAVVAVAQHLPVRDEDIEVIETLEATQEIDGTSDPVTSPQWSRVVNPLAKKGPSPRRRSKINVRKSTSPAVTEKPSASPVSKTVPDVPIIDLEKDNTNEDTNDIQVLGMVIKPKPPKRKRSSLGLGGQNQKSNGYLQAQGSVKKAKNTVRRTSLNNAMKNMNSNACGSWGWGGFNLNSVAQSSKKIHKRKGNRQKGFHQNFHSRPAHQQWNALHRNRAREHNRQVLLRPENQLPNPHAVSNGRDLPCNWVPVRHRNGPPAIDAGSNIMMADSTGSSSNRPAGSLRPIVIDGSNVAFGHGDLTPKDGHRFSPRGIQICVEFFRKRGHTEVIAFVPKFRQKFSECRDPQLLEALERDGCVRFTPSREAGNQRITSYDDLFVIQYAHQTGGIIISNDNFRDIYSSNPQLQETIKLRQMMFTWVTSDVIMFPQDPLGPGGPTLDGFLKF